MEYREFKEQLLKELEGLIKESDITIINKEILKNNGIKLDDLVIQKKGVEIAPVVYLEDFYEKYLNGSEIEEIAEQILFVADNAITADISILSKITWDGIKDNLYISVVNADANEELLRETPHRKIEDLAIFAKIKVDEFNGGEASIRVTNDLLSMIKKTKDEFLNQAISNSEKLEFTCRSMRETIFGILDEDSEILEEIFPMADELPMYVVTTNNSVNGAAILGCRQALEDVVDKVGDDCFILPSSIYEVLLVPKKSGIDLESLQGMVREVNRTEVAPGEILSNNVYHYDRKSKKLTIAKVGDDIEEKKLSKMVHMAM